MNRLGAWNCSRESRDAVQGLNFCFYVRVPGHTSGSVPDSRRWVASLWFIDRSTAMRLVALHLFVGL